MATRGEITENTSKIPKELSFGLLSKITNDFSNDRKLGGTQFGTLYKGIMEDGSIIAVKKPDDNAQIPPETIFKNEVQKIMKLEHENLVRLVGFCSEAQHKIVPSGEINDIVDITANLLCYEYFPNGNLDDYLFGPRANNDFSSDEQGTQEAEHISSAEEGTSKETDDVLTAEPRTKMTEDFSWSEQGIPKVRLNISSAEPGTSNAVKNFSSAKPNIDWDTRFKIINGICHGLLYMHSLDCPIIHMDLKLQNIWLGANMVAKIGNFGLSRIFGTDRTRIYTKTVVGTYGHMAPEYLNRGEISTKADIYSLGLLIIEITTKEKNYPDPKELAARQYITKIRTGWTAEHIASKYSSLDAERLQQVYACIQIGLECVQLDRTKRPSIEEIVYRLNTI